MLNIILIFRIINQQTKLCGIFFSKINPDAHKYIHILQGGSGGNSPLKPKTYEKMEAFPVLHQISHFRRADSPIMLWIQIRARRSGGAPPIFSLLKYM